MVSAFLFRKARIFLLLLVSFAMRVLMTVLSIAVSMSIWKSPKRLRLWMR